MCTWELSKLPRVNTIARDLFNTFAINHYDKRNEFNSFYTKPSKRQINNRNRWKSPGKDILFIIPSLKTQRHFSNSFDQADWGKRNLEPLCCIPATVKSTFCNHIVLLRLNLNRCLTTHFKLSSVRVRKRRNSRPPRHIPGKLGSPH